MNTSLCCIIWWCTDSKTSGLCCSGTNGLLILTSVLRHDERDTILTMLTPSRCTAPLVMFKISVSRDPKILTLAATVENSTLCPNGRNSIVCRHGPMSTFNWHFFKILKFSAHLFRAWRHPHSNPTFSLGVYDDNGDCHILCARA